jgi:hypothetical protein
MAKRLRQRKISAIQVLEVPRRRIVADLAPALHEANDLDLWRLIAPLRNSPQSSVL